MSTVTAFAVFLAFGSVLCIWLSLAVEVGKVARQKGRSFYRWAILSVVVSAAVTLPILSALREGKRGL
jgi:hypothetical protein